MPRWLRRKTILQVTATVLSVAAVAVSLGAIFIPCEEPAATGVTNPQAKATDKTMTQQPVPPRPSRAQWEALARKPLRRALVDPVVATATAAPAVVSAQRELASRRLVGVAVERGHSFAIFASGSGTIELRRVGETLGDSPAGPRVMAIEDHRVLLHNQGETVTLALEEKGK